MAVEADVTSLIVIMADMMVSACVKTHAMVALTTIGFSILKGTQECIPFRTLGSLCDIRGIGRLPAVILVTYVVKYPTDWVGMQGHSNIIFINDTDSGARLRCPSKWQRKFQEEGFRPFEKLAGT